jgi:spore coat protein H
MVKKNLNIIIIGALLVLAMSAGAIVQFILGSAISPTGSSTFDKNADFAVRGINEDRSVYDNDPLEITDLYVTVLKSTVSSAADGKRNNPITFDAMNQLMVNVGTDVQDDTLEIIFQEGNVLGPQKGMYGYSADTSNATIELRGRSTRETPQKSYGIKLFDGSSPWNNQKTINLNKHPYDLTRVRNKLSFDYFAKISGLSSLRTRFVRLHVKDFSSGNSKAAFVSYGLYTQIEQPNKTFLASHGLDPNGSLYKAEDFEFFRYEDFIRKQDDPRYVRAEFEKRLSIKTTKDHSKLIEMLDEVNNLGSDINDIVATHFDRNNLLTWLSVNIIMGNIDTRTQNFMIYSPNNSDKWYFMQWDYDGAWGWETQAGHAPRLKGSWESGVSNYWGNILISRFLKIPDNLKQLTERVQAVSKIINKENTHKLLQGYYPIVSKIVKVSPDLGGLPASVADYDKEYWGLENHPAANLQKYLKSIENPMPIYLGDATKSDGLYSLTWDNSYDFQGDDLKYDFSMAYDPSFKNTIKSNTNLTGNTVNIGNIAPGTYYWKVTVKDSKGNTQQAFDVYEDGFSNRYFGVKQLVIK